MTFNRLRVWMKSWIYAPQHQLDADFAAAELWARQYSPVGQPDTYEVIHEFSQKQYDMRVGLAEALDKKADDLMRFVVLIVGAIVAAASTRLIRIESSAALALAILAILAFLASVGIAAIARIPAELSAPMTAQEILAVADSAVLPTKEQIHSVAAASLHVAVIGIDIINKWKSIQIKRATRCFFFGIAFFLLALTPSKFWTSPTTRSGVELRFEFKSS